MQTIREHLIATNKAVLISVCCVCKRMTGIKAGRGVCGISHGLCVACCEVELMKFEKKQAQRAAEEDVK